MRTNRVPVALITAVLFVIILTLFVITPEVALAHTGKDAGDFMAGLWHPVLGFDHFLAMVSVGILSAQMGGRAVWSVPLTFVLVMIFGAFLGYEGIKLLEVEIGIALSVVALGVSLAVERKLPTALAMIAVGIFAIFHGYAHGAEIPIVKAPIIYAVGFVTGTALLHISGVFIGVICNHFRFAQFLRYVGAGIAGVGIHLLYVMVKYAS